MKIKLTSFTRMVILSLTLGIFLLFTRQANALTLEQAMTWIHVGDKWIPSQMMLVRVELKEPTSYHSEKYSGPQTAQGLMNAFDENYNRKHLRTTVSALSKENATGIEKKVTGRDKWSELLLEKGITNSFTGTEIDARYPRHTWLKLMLEKGITINYLFDYLYCMADRYQLAFLENHPELWKAGIQGIPPSDNWNNYKAAYLEELVKDYNQHRHFVAEVAVSKTKAKTQLETTRARIKATKARVAAAKARIKAKSEASKSSIPHPPKVPHMPQLPTYLIEPDTMTLSLLENLVNQLEQTVKDLQRQNRQKAAEHIKETLEHAKKALEQIKTEKPSLKEPKPEMKKKSRYPPL